MTEALYEAFVSIGWWEILVTMCNTLITFLIIKKFLYKPVRKMLAARSEEVQSMYATAEKAQSEAEQMRSEYTERLSKAKEEAAELKDEVADLSVMIASKIVERDVKPEDHERFIEDFIDKVG